MPRNTEKPTAAFEVKIRVEDADLLLESFSEEVGEGTVESALTYFCTKVNHQPEDAGYSIKRCSMRKDPRGDYEYHILKVTAQVLNEKKLRETAREAAEACYNHGDGMEHATLSELLAEVICTSNATPSPRDMGYVIHFVLDAEPDRPRRSQEDSPSPS